MASRTLAPFTALPAIPTIQQETPVAPAGVLEQPLQPISQSLDWEVTPVVRSAFLRPRIILSDYVGHKA